MKSYEMKSYPKKCWSRQPLSCVRSFDLSALLGRPALLSAFIWKIYSPLITRAYKVNENKF